MKYQRRQRNEEDQKAMNTIYAIVTVMIIFLISVPKIIGG